MHPEHIAGRMEFDHQNTAAVHLVDAAGYLPQSPFASIPTGACLFSISQVKQSRATDHDCPNE